jgi:hypothetical protein
VVLVGWIISAALRISRNNSCSKSNKRRILRLLSLHLELKMPCNFTQEQLALLRHLQAVEMAKKIDVRFEEPEDKEDTRSIRRLVYLDGGLDTYKYLLNFDAELNAQLEAEKQARLSSQNGTGQNPTVDQPETF